jgi:hypothetical protein
MTDPVPAVHRWPTNGHLIYDAWRLGYVSGHVYDATPGRSSLWTQVLRDAPECDAEFSWNWLRDDFRNLPQADNKYDTVLYDPPYKLNGTPAMGEMDERYGIAVPTKEPDRLDLMTAGLAECIRITRKGGHILAKCQDQVCSGRMVWQTDLLTIHAYAEAQKVDRFDMIGHTVPQPPGRAQRHAYGRGSTLLVFRKR